MTTEPATLGNVPTQKRCIALGTPLGAAPTRTPRPGIPPASNATLTIRCGGRFVVLDENSARVWAEASTPALLPDLNRLGPAGLSVGDELLQHGLLAVLPDRSQPSPDQIGDFTSLIPLPLARGVGATTESPHRFRLLARTGQPILNCGLIDYIIGSYIDGRASIGLIVARASSSLRVNTSDTQMRMFRMTETLLAAGAVALDRPDGYHR